MPISIERRFAAIFVHVGSYLFLNYAAPFLISYLMFLFAKDKKDEFLAEHSRQSFNFDASIGLYLIALYIVCFGRLFWNLGLLYFGTTPDYSGHVGKDSFLLRFYIPVIAIAIFVVVMNIRAAKAAYRGEPFKYPLAIQFIKSGSL